MNESFYHNEIPPLEIGDSSPQKTVTFYKYFTKLGERLIGFFYLNIKLGKDK